MDTSSADFVDSSTAEVVDRSAAMDTSSADIELNLPDPYIPSEGRSLVETNRYDAYLTLGGISLQLLDANIASRLQVPMDEDTLHFKVYCTMYPYQYSMVIIQNLAHNLSGLENNVVGEMTIKGVSFHGSAYRSLGEKEEIAQHLRMFCDSLDDSTAVPDELSVVELSTTRINLSVNDHVSRRMERSRKKQYEMLQTIRDIINQNQEVTLGITFLCNPTESEYIKTLQINLEAFSTFDKNQRDDDYPFTPFFEKSPNALQLHYGNAPQPGTGTFDFINHHLPAVNQFDTPEEHLVAHVMGSICDHMVQVDQAHELRASAFDGFAMELPYHRGERFLLFVNAAGADVCQPREGEVTLISLSGISRVLPTTNMYPKSKVVDQLVAESLAGLEQLDFVDHIKRTCGHFFGPGVLSDEMAQELKKESGQSAHDHGDRVANLVENWISTSLVLATNSDDNGDPKTPESCNWWKAERIQSVTPGVPHNYNTYIVTLPLVPKEEAVEGEDRRCVEVEFPKLMPWPGEARLTTQKTEASTATHTLQLKTEIYVDAACAMPLTR